MSQPDLGHVIIWDQTFDGSTLDLDTAEAVEGVYQSLRGTELHGHATSARWNLPEGVIVGIFEHDGGAGRQFFMWGKSEVPHLDAHAFSDVSTSWVWHRV